jgi:predicted nuclease of predicted toxin-antitoxin system
VKLLFDENLSPRLPQLLADIFPNSIHVRDIGMKAANDSTIWDHAKNRDFIIVSKDADMHDLSLALGLPPKVIWIRLGNCSTRQVEGLLRADLDVVKRFVIDDDVSLLVLP